MRKYRDMNLEGQGGERRKWNTQTIENTEREREREGGRIWRRNGEEMECRKDEYTRKDERKRGREIYKA